MRGNVEEWVKDCVPEFNDGNDYEGAPSDGSAWDAGGHCVYVLRDVFAPLNTYHAPAPRHVTRIIPRGGLAAVFESLGR